MSIQSFAGPLPLCSLSRIVKKCSTLNDHSLKQQVATTTYVWLDRNMCHDEVPSANTVGCVRMTELRAVIAIRMDLLCIYFAFELAMEDLT